MRRGSASMAQSNRSWWSISEAAKYLGIAPGELCQVGIDGWGPKYVRAHGERRYRPADVRAWRGSGVRSAAHAHKQRLKGAGR